MTVVSPSGISPTHELFLIARSPNATASYRLFALTCAVCSMPSMSVAAVWHHFSTGEYRLDRPGLAFQQPCSPVRNLSFRNVFGNQLTQQTKIDIQNHLRIGHQCGRANGRL